MQKVKEFIKKYWLWLTLGLILILVVLIIVLLFNRNRGGRIDPKIRSVESPYFLLGYDIDVELNVGGKNFKNREPVIEVFKSNNPSLNQFLTTFVSEDIDAVTFDDYWYVKDGISVSYTSTTSLLIVSKVAGRWLVDYRIFSSKDIQSFIEEYFGVQSVNDVIISAEENRTSYEGHFVFEDIERVGTTSLNGYAYNFIVDELGQLVDINILVLRDSDILSYQNISTSSLSSLLETSRYPKFVVHKELEEKYYQKPPFAIGNIRLNQISVREVDNLYLFNSFDTPYIYPTYKLSGDGIVQDMEGETYRSVSDVYICAVSPDYLYERQMREPAPSADPQIEL